MYYIQAIFKNKTLTYNSQYVCKFNTLDEVKQYLTNIATQYNIPDNYLVFMGTKYKSSKHQLSLASNFDNPKTLSKYTFDYKTQCIYKAAYFGGCMISEKYGVILRPKQNIMMYAGYTHTHSPTAVKDLTNSFNKNFKQYLIDQIKEGNYSVLLRLTKSQLRSVVLECYRITGGDQQLCDTIYTFVIKNYKPSQYNIFEFDNPSKNFVIKFFDIYYNTLFDYINDDAYMCVNAVCGLYSTIWGSNSVESMKQFNLMLTEQDGEKFTNACIHSTNTHAIQYVVDVYSNAVANLLGVEFNRVRDLKEMCSEFDSGIISTLCDQIVDKLFYNYKIDYGSIFTAAANAKGTASYAILKRIEQMLCPQFSECDDDIMDQIHNFFD